MICWIVRNLVIKEKVVMIAIYKAILYFTLIHLRLMEVGGLFWSWRAFRGGLPV